MAMLHDAVLKTSSLQWALIALAFVVLIVGAHSVFRRHDLRMGRAWNPLRGFHAYVRTLEKGEWFALACVMGGSVALLGLAAWLGGSPA